MKKLMMVFFLALQFFSCGNPLNGKSTADPAIAPSTPISSITFAGLQSITSVGVTSATLSWTSHPQAGFYLIEEVTSNPAVVVATVLAPASSKVISGLSVSTTYKYRVRAADALFVLENNTNVITYTTPASVPPSIANLNFWGDASAMSLADGSSVASFTDLSGANNHATQLTVVNQPTFRANQVNTLPAIEFNGSTHFLSFFAPLALQPATICLVGKYNSSVNAPYLGNDIGSTFLGYYGSTLYYYSGAASLNSPRAYPLAAFELVCGIIQSSGSSAALKTNGLLFMSTPSINYGTDSYAYIGRRSGERFNGQIAEIVSYSRALNSTELSTIENYLKAKYAIP
jgi:hypothetical protein